MFDFLDNIKLISQNDYAGLMTREVEPYLEKRRREIYFSSYDGKKIFCEAYEKKLSRGSIVILHGFTESAEKFREITYYFRKAGYSVFVPDLRGHGKSYRTSSDEGAVEIESFNEYKEDLRVLIEKLVKPSSREGKIYIYSHSLGSAVALLYMMEHPDVIDKAVLSSPMICGNMGMPVAVAGTAARLLCKLGGKNISAPGRCAFNPDAVFADSDAMCFERYHYYFEKRKKEPLYRTSGPSFSWVKASLEARDRILKEYDREKISSELLIFMPQEDKQLLGEYTEKFAQLSHTPVKKVRSSKHEIFMSNDDTLRWYIEKILDFVSD